MSFRVETNIWIDRNPSDVFSFITEAGNFSKYVPGLTKSEQVGDTRGVGTRLVSSMATMGQTFDFTAEWTRYEQDAAIGAKNVDGPVGSESLTSLTAENGGTRLERVLDVEPHGLLANLAAPLIRRRVQRDSETEFANLKDLLES
jgi:carbon monoxide dehydrogenase subunit G